MKTILFFICCLSFTTLSAQLIEDKEWCKINCAASIHKENAKVIYNKILIDSFRQELEYLDTVKFPVRIVLVEETNYKPDSLLKAQLHTVVDNLNHSFRNTKLKFYVDRIEVIESELKIEDLSENRFELYDTFSQAHDLEDMMTIFILDHKHEYCRISNRSISCSRTGGFSYILSSRANNVVMSKFDLKDSKVVAHEVGHFFGLFHTFEESLFGKDTFNPDECSTTGDLICDTSPDPGTIYEVYVNYTSCEMMGLKDSNGNEYSPILENYMSYYKPCYLTEYSFTKQQELVMTMASQLAIRKKLSR